MINLTTLIIKNKTSDTVINFGIPNSDNELKEMFQLRFEVYSNKNYINPEKYPDKLEKDEYDEKGKCVYFIAKSNNTIISSARLIDDKPLPTEIYFKFDEPREMSKIPSEKRVEIGRLITIPFKVNNNFLPRHIVTLFIIKTIFDYSLSKNYLGGYAFVKKKLNDKLSILNFPFHKIKEYEQKYPKEGPLYNYFNSKNDPVIPIYYLSNEIENFFTNFLKRKIFIVNNKNTITFNNTWLYDLDLKVGYILHIIKNV